MNQIIILSLFFILIFIFKNSRCLRRNLKRWKPVLRPENFHKVRSANDILSNYYYKAGRKEIGYKFENYCGYLFNKNGFSAQWVGAASEYNPFRLGNMGDGGVDLVVSSENIDAIVQCKAFNKHKDVNLSAVREFMHVMYMNNKKYGFYITTSVFTEAALAEVNQFYYKKGYVLYCIDKNLLTRIINGKGKFTEYHPKKWYGIYKRLKSYQ